MPTATTSVSARASPNKVQPEAGASAQPSTSSGDPFLDYLEHLRLRHKAIGAALHDYKSVRLTPHPNQKSLLTAVEPLVLTQRDKDFFAALPLEDAKFSERFFADLQHSMVHGEIGTSTIQDLTKKMALQPTDEDICAQVMREVAQRRAKKERRFKPRAASAMEQRGKDSGAAPSTPSAPPQKSIAQRRFEEYIRERQELLQAEMDKKFKAKPVPASSLYKREEVAGTTSEEATATRDIRQRRRATTLGSMQSSLYLAQTDPATLKQKKFRAKEIPADVLNPPTISPEATELRQRKIKERALELLARSALPARMEKYAVTATATADDCGQHGKKKCRCPDPYADCTFHPRIRRDIPDYKALQAQFARSLEARRAQLSHGRKRAVSMGGASVPTVAEVQAQAASTTKTTDIKAITKPHRKPVLNATEKKPAEAATSVVNGKEVAPVVVVDIAESASTNIFIEGANEPAHVEAIATPVPTKQSSMTLGRDTRSAQVKREYNRRLIEERERLKEEERKLLAERKARVKHVATKIQNALHAESVEAEERKRRSHATAGTRFAESTKAYRAYLDDMNRRLEEQPCMFERLQLAAAKDRAEKMFEKTLKKHGVSSQSL